MKPRSILRTIEWFPSFANLKGQNWDEEDPDKHSKKTMKPVSKVRREYILNAHGEAINLSYDEFMSGMYDEADVESAARNDKISFEFFGFGYVDANNIIRVTDVGRLIVENKFNEEFLLKQLLKIQFPSPISKKGETEGHVFAMEILLRMFSEFDYLTHLEVAFIFGCMDIDDADNLIKGIKKFREEYSKLLKKNNPREVGKIFTKVLTWLNSNLDNKPETYIDYADALIRAVTYTGLFLTRGRGIYTKLYVPDHSKAKVKLLSEKFQFVFFDGDDKDKFMEYFGDPYNIILPWDNPELRKKIVKEKLVSYKNIISKAEQEGHTIKISEIQFVESLIVDKDYKSLVIADQKLSEGILSVNENLFIDSISKTEEARNEILEKFEDISSGNEDMAALWLEVNTWKSLIAINGKHRVQRNFRIEEDLTPRSFAPGIGNTPDMEVYIDGHILIPEVSLMSGVRQWEHEGSSVISHVLSFIEKHEDKKVYGLFISKSLNVRTVWQFFILNKESWMGRNVPVIPLTIGQYTEIIEFLYKTGTDYLEFTKLIEMINKSAIEAPEYTSWLKNIDKIIRNWKLVLAS